MICGSTESRALEPLWGLSLGATVGSGLAVVWHAAGPGWFHLSMFLIGCGLFVVGVRRERQAPSILWFAAGLALVGGHALHTTADRRQLADLMDPEAPVWARARLVVTDGWAAGRWGWTTRVRVLDARHDHMRIPKLRRCRLEVRGSVRVQDLPDPGDIVHALVSIRGSPPSPLLVASSIRLLESDGDSRPVPKLRDRLAHTLLGAAGTDVGRIRAAELAAALSLGRRDLLPRERRDGWRRSGLAHVLAVSGLHVGLVAGMAWLLLSLTGASPTTARIVILLILPSYALLAGGSPSAVRAALMGVIYLGARLLGRAVVPMSAVLLTAFLLLLADPTLVTEVSFQLTVLITAALVRWAPALSTAIPLPRWIAAAISVPIIAQLAAAPLIAHHFAFLVPGAAAANLLVPWLLGPVVLGSVAATAAAPISPTFAGWLLDCVDFGTSLLWWAAAPGRLSELVPPAVPMVLLICTVAIGLMALFPGRPGKVGAVAYLAVIAVFAASWWVIPPTTEETVELLPVSHGLALRVSSADGHLLMDGGGTRREAAELLAPTRIHHLDAVLASHGDEDHLAGLASVLRTTRVDKLVVPVWLTASPEAVPLIRTARRRGVRVVQVARGSRIEIGGSALEVLWPPSDHRPASENERSLVARLESDRGTILLTADIGSTTERRLAATSHLGSTIVIIPHHGSRDSASPGFLDAVRARFALIPAGPKNLHHHPHLEVLDRLDQRRIPYRMPIRDGRCGVRWQRGDWRMYPEVASGDR